MQFYYVGYGEGRAVSVTIALPSLFSAKTRRLFLYFCQADFRRPIITRPVAKLLICNNCRLTETNWLFHINMRFESWISEYSQDETQTGKESLTEV